MADPRSYTIDEFEKLFGPGAGGLVTPPAPGTEAAPPIPAPRSYTPDEFDKISPGRWVPEKSQQKATESGYELMPEAIGKRVLSEAALPLDLYNKAARWSNDKYGTGLPFGKKSAVEELQKSMGLDRYKPPENSLEEAVYDAATAGVSALVPYGGGVALKGLGGIATRALPSVPRLGSRLMATGDFLTAGGPGATVASTIASELGGEVAGNFAPEDQKENAKTLGAIGTGLVAGGVMAPIKHGWSKITEPIRDPEGTVARILNEKLGRPAADVLAGTPGPPRMGEMTPTAEELIPGNTGIVELDAYARSKAPKVYDAATEHRNVNRLGNVRSGTEITGPEGDPGIALATRQTRLANPSMYESDLQRQAQAAAGALPTRAGLDAEQSIGATINKQYNDALDARINKVAEVNKLVTGLTTRGKPGALILDFKNSAEGRDPITRAGTGILDEGKYQTWMDKNKHSLTPAQFARLSNMRTAQEEIKAFDAQVKDLAKQFPVTPGGSHAGIADKYVPTEEGKSGGSRAAKYRELVKDDPAAMSDLFDYRMAQWRGDKDFTNVDGSINHNRLTELIARDRAWLDQMPPHLTNKLTTARDAQALFDTQATIRTTALKDFENSAAKHLLGLRDPMEGMKDLLTKGNPIHNAREVMHQLRSSPAARNGLRRNFIDYTGKEHFIDTDAAGKQTFNPKGFQEFFTKYGDTARELYGRQGYDLLKRVNDDIANQAASIARSETAAARGASRMPDRLQLGAVGTALDKASHYIANSPIGQILNLGTTGGSIAHFLFTGNMLSTAASSVLTGANVVGLFHAARRRGVDSVNDRIAELLNNPKAMALAMHKMPDDPNHAILRRLASTLAGVSYGSAAAKGTDFDDKIEAPRGAIPRTRVGGDVVIPQVMPR